MKEKKTITMEGLEAIMTSKTGVFDADSHCRGYYQI